MFKINTKVYSTLFVGIAIIVGSIALSDTAYAINVTTKQHARMVEQCRVKQLLTKDGQNMLRQLFADYIKRQPKSEHQHFENQLINILNSGLVTSQNIHNTVSPTLHWFFRWVPMLQKYLKWVSGKRFSIPVRDQTTHILYQYLIEDVMQRKKELQVLCIDEIIAGRFYQGQGNELPTGTLPMLKSQSYWGNESYAASSILLLNALFSCRPNALVYVPSGSAFTHYLFRTNGVYLPLDICPQNYVLAGSRNARDNAIDLKLLCHTERGGHRYFTTESLAYPQDASSAIGVACGLSDDQIRKFVAKDLKKHKLPYGFTRVCILKPKDLSDVSKIQAGDIIYFDSKTAPYVALISDRENCGLNITTIGFNRNIGATFTERCCGGGVIKYSLADMVKKYRRIYILRPPAAPLRQVISEEQLIASIDEAYYAWRGELANLTHKELSYLKSGKFLPSIVTGP